MLSSISLSHTLDAQLIVADTRRLHRMPPSSIKMPSVIMHVEIMPKSSNYGPLKFGVRRLCTAVKRRLCVDPLAVRLQNEGILHFMKILWNGRKRNHAVWPAQQLPSKTERRKSPED